MVQKDPDAEVRSAAVAAAAHITHPDVPPILGDALTDKAGHVRLAAVKALATFEPCWASEHLVQALGDSRDEVAFAATTPLETWRESCVSEALIRGLRSANQDVQRWCTNVLGTRKDVAAVEPLMALLHVPDTSSSVRRWAVSALGEIGDRRAVPVLIGRLDAAETGGEEREAVIEALGAIGDRSAAPALLRELQVGMADDAVRALGALKDPRAVGPLVARLRSPIGRPSDKELIQALASIGDLTAVDAIIPLVGSDDSIIRDRAVETLQALTGQTFGADKKAWEQWWKANRKRSTPEPSETSRPVRP